MLCLCLAQASLTWGQRVPALSFSFQVTVGLEEVGRLAVYFVLSKHVGELELYI